MYVYPGLNSLIWAAFEGHTDVLKILLENGADVNFENMDGQLHSLF